MFFNVAIDCFEADCCDYGRRGLRVVTSCEVAVIFKVDWDFPVWDRFREGNQVVQWGIVV